MRIKYVITAVLLTALIYVADAAGSTSNAQIFNRRINGTANLSQDNVAAMAMDANYTYVVQNLMRNPTVSAPYTSVSLSGALGVAFGDWYEHASVIVDRIDNSTGTVVNLARIDIVNDIGSYVTATAVELYDNKLYIVGYFAGQVKPNGVLSTKTAAGEDMFICTVNTTSTGVTDWSQSGGNGEERATCIDESGGNMYVGGYYLCSNSTSDPSTWYIPSSGTTTTADPVDAIGQHKPFIANFSGSTLDCTKATGWWDMTNSSSSAEINGIVTVTAQGVVVNYVTGKITGGSNTPSLSASSTGATMFTARFVNKNLNPPAWPDTYGWALLEGTCWSASPPLANGGKAIILGSSTELYVAGAAAYTTGTGPTGYHSGTTDAVLIKYTGITGVTPTHAFTIPMGTGYNDVANALVYDGSNICVAGGMGCGNYSYGSGSSITSSSQAHSFVARFTTSGTLDWEKTSEAYANNATSTAIACAGTCNVAIGGAYDRQQTWDIFQVDGATSPSTYRLYAHFMPVQRLYYSSPFAENYPLNNWPNSVTPTANGASSYVWSFNDAAYPAINVTFSASTSATTVVSLTGGTINSYFDLITTGSYTRGGSSCSNVTKTRVNQTTNKNDGTTGIGDVDGSANTLNVFPNPFAQSVNLNYSFEQPGMGRMQVVDLTGRVISEIPLGAQSGTETVTTTNWAAGVYIINLLQGETKIFSKEILKR